MDVIGLGIVFFGVALLCAATAKWEEKGRRDATSNYIDREIKRAKDRFK